MQFVLGALKEVIGFKPGDERLPRLAVALQAERKRCVSNWFPRFRLSNR